MTEKNLKTPESEHPARWWHALPDPHQFMAQLKLKAGLAADFWDDGITLARYSVEKWKEA